MAIAHVATTANQEVTSTSLTYPHDCTAGSNRRLYTGVSGAVLSDTITSVEYVSGTAQTLVDKNVVLGGRFMYLFSLNSPASNSNNVIITSSSSVLIRSTTVSYTGCSQVAANDAQAKNVDDTAQTSNTTSVTVVADNSWAVLWGQNVGASAVAAGTGSTLRGGAASDYAMFDSNAALAPGVRSMQFTWSTTQTSVGVMASFAPPSTAAPTSGNMFLVF